MNSNVKEIQENFRNHHQNERGIIEHYNNLEPALPNNYNYRNNIRTACDVKPAAQIVYNCKKPSRKHAPLPDSKYDNMKMDFNTEGYNPNFLVKTDNQKLVGKPNPKTLIPPTITPKITDLEYWKSDKDLTLSFINNQKKRYNNESGYTVHDEDLTIDYSKPKSYYCGYKFPKTKRYPVNFENIDETNLNL